MTSKRSKKLKKVIIIMVAVFVVFAVAFFVLAGVSKGKANEIRENSSMLFGTAKGDVAALESLGGVSIGLGIFFIVAGAILAAVMLGIFYRTCITVADGKVKGYAVKGGIKRVEFSAPLSEVKMPMTNGKMMLTFNIKGVRYTVYTDEANAFYNLLNQADK